MTQQLIERFFRYVAIESQSNASATVLPTTEGQKELAQLLFTELQQMGLEDVSINENAIVLGTLKGNTSAPKIGFVAHLDTVDVNLNANIHPQILQFTGADLVLNKEKNIVLSVEEHPEIKKYLNEEIIFSDGTSVLGADNKAAIATIMTMLAHFIQTKEPHGDIIVAFVPDEEIGLRGAKALDLKKFPVDFAYTIDCCELGEVVYENFNAASVRIEIQGVPAHPMSAKGVLVNPLLIATDIINGFDRLQTPEHTEGKEGYIWATDLSANASNAVLLLSIRDFDKESFETKKSLIQQVVQKISKDNPKAVISCKIDDVYANISDSLTDDKRSLNLIFDSMKSLNLVPNVIPMRGGTDGAALSAKGITTPNYFTGAHNFHSNFEFLPISSFKKSLDLTIEILKQATLL